MRGPNPEASQVRGARVKKIHSQGERLEAGAHELAPRKSFPAPDALQGKRAHTME